MNYAQQIEKELGLERGEEFRLDGEDTVYKITADGITDGRRKCMPGLLSKIIIGERKIIKFPWEPREGTECFHVSKAGRVVKEAWEGSEADLAMWELGKIYRSRREARTHMKEDKEFWQEIQKSISAAAKAEQERNKKAVGRRKRQNDTGKSI